MGRKCLWLKATDQAPDAKTDIAFCGQGGILAGSDIRAANRDGAVRPCGAEAVLVLLQRRLVTGDGGALEVGLVYFGPGPTSVVRSPTPS